jgi:uncharacterized BrkB/YihY/UPF0761 family membrane protein
LSKLAGLIQRLYLLGRRVFNLALGLVFLILSGISGIVTYQEWRIYQQTPAEGPVKFWVVAAFTFLLVILGLYSFAKARSVR